MDWAYLLAYVIGMVNEKLLLRNEYLVGENRILKAQLKGRVLLSDAERITLAELGHRLGRKAFEEVPGGTTGYDFVIVSETVCPGNSMDQRPVAHVGDQELTRKGYSYSMM